MATCTGELYVEEIDRNQCIGNSLPIINNNFKELDIAVCEAKNSIDSLNLLFVGIVSYFPRNSAPTGWLALSGQTVSRTTYSDLWAFANTSGNITTNDSNWTTLSAYGSFSPGNGSTTFRLPDLRGEVIRTWDNGRGADSGRTIGSFQAGTTGSSGTAIQARPRNVALLACIKH